MFLQDTCQICCEEDQPCYKCDQTDKCSIVCKTCFLTWGKPLCMQCNHQLSRIELVAWIGYRDYDKHISPYWVNIHINHEKTRLPIIRLYIEWCDYKVYKKRFDRWGTQKVARGFVAKPHLDQLNLDNFTSDDLADVASANSAYFPCTKSSCKGLVLFSKCSVCLASYCPKCLEIDEGSGKHRCSPAALESVQEIKKSSKPCPACRYIITKDGGCDHMRCSNCGTRFTWSTGKIDAAHNTNPLPDSEVFGKMVKSGAVVTVASETASASDIEYILYERDSSAIAKFASAIYDTDKLKTRFNSDIIKLRMKFVKGQVDEPTWGRQLLRLMDTYECSALLNDTLMLHATRLKAKDTWETLVETTTTMLEAIGNAYQCKVPVLKKTRTNDPPITF